MKTNKALLALFDQYGIREEDLRENFVKASGPGGQNINKVSTCVILTHKPSGVSVKCQSARTQAQNREKARWQLIKKIIEAKHSVAAKAKKEKFIKRARSRKRPKGLKEEILKLKKKVAEKKKSRAKIRPQKDFDE